MTMRPNEVLARAVELDSAGRPYVLATVVAVRRPTSARPGARGIIEPDGTIRGWVGGSCAQPVVVREALRALAEGQPRLLRISKDPPSELAHAQPLAGTQPPEVGGGAPRRHPPEGIVELVMTCHSGGTLEIYVEPHLPAPQLWVAGTTPIASALVELGAGLGFDVTLVDPIAAEDAFPGATRVVATADLRGLDPDVSPYVVVASQGIWDEEALALALRRDVAYVGLVASPTRAAVVRDYLRDVGIPEERLAALRAPAGLDLGAETAEEIALSILAELVQVRRGRAPFVASPGPATLAGGVEAGDEAHGATAPGAMGPGVAGGVEQDIVLLDPVCGMTVHPDDARHLAEHDGVVYAFCTLGCRARFVKEPTAFVSAGASPASSVNE